MRVYLESPGVKVPDKVSQSRIGNLNFNVVDPDGHIVEIVQYQPDRARNIARTMLKNQRGHNTVTSEAPATFALVRNG